MYIIYKINRKQKLIFQKFLTTEEAKQFEKNLKIAKYYRDNYLKAFDQINVDTKVGVGEWQAARTEYRKQSDILSKTFPYMGIDSILKEYQKSYMLETKTLLHGQ